MKEREVMDHMKQKKDTLITGLICAILSCNCALSKTVRSLAL